MEYNNCQGEWSLPSDLLLPKNPIEDKMYSILNQTILPPPLNNDYKQENEWPLRIAILGKRLSGKSTLTKMIAENHKIKIIQIQDLVKKAIEAVEYNETMIVRSLIRTKKDNLEKMELLSDPNEEAILSENSISDSQMEYVDNLGQGLINLFNKYRINKCSF